METKIRARLFMFDKVQWLNCIINNNTPELDNVTLLDLKMN